MAFRYFMQLALLIALVFAPICGIGGIASAKASDVPVAEHHATTTGQSHCDDMGDDGKSAADVECWMACAGVLAPVPLVEQARIVTSVPMDIAAVKVVRGLQPAAEPRPPQA